MISGCESSKIDDKTAVKIYVENLIVEEKYSAIPDSIEIHRQKVFSNFNSSKKDFDEYLSSIKSNPEKWESFFKKADSYLNELKKNGKIK